MAFLPQGGSAQVAIAAGESIAVGAVRGATANVTYPVGYPKGPSDTVVNGTETFGPFATATTVTVYAAQGTAEYVTGTSPVCTDGPVAYSTDPLTGVSLVLPDGTLMRLQMQSQQYVGSATSQYFTVPDGVTVIEMEGTGSGGGGGGGFNAGSGGGGGGGSGGQTMYRKPFIVTPGETLTINVPFGGLAGALSGNGGRPVPDGPSGSVLTVTGSTSGQLIALTSGGFGRAGTATVGGQGGDASGGRFNTGITAPAAGTAGTSGTDFQTENSAYGNTGGMGGTGCCSTGASISGGRGGRSSNLVQSGSGGASGAVSGAGGGGGGGTGFPDGTSGSNLSGGNGGADGVAGTAGQTYGAGGGGGGRAAVGGTGGNGMLRIYY